MWKRLLQCVTWGLYSEVLARLFSHRCWYPKRVFAFVSYNVFMSLVVRSDLLSDAAAWSRRHLVSFSDCTCLKFAQWQFSAYELFAQSLVFPGIWREISRCDDSRWCHLELDGSFDLQFCLGGVKLLVVRIFQLRFVTLCCYCQWHCAILWTEWHSRVGIVSEVNFFFTDYRCVILTELSWPKVLPRSPGSNLLGDKVVLYAALGKSFKYGTVFSQSTGVEWPWLWLSWSLWLETPAPVPPMFFVWWGCGGGHRLWRERRCTTTRLCGGRVFVV